MLWKDIINKVKRLPKAERHLATWWHRWEQFLTLNLSVAPKFLVGAGEGVTSGWTRKFLSRSWQWYEKLLPNHAINPPFGETSIVVSDGGAVRLSSRLVRGRDVQNRLASISNGNFNLRDTTRCKRKTNFPSKFLSLARARSLSYTCINTPGWLSE